MANVGKKMGESSVPYFTCHAATLEGDVEKTCVSHFLQQLLKQYKLQRFRKPPNNET